MSKQFIAKQDLERIALQEIRSFPGGEFVVSVDVEYRGDGRPGSGWKLHAVMRDGGDIDRVQQATTTTKDRLRHRYTLRIES